jgi:hypothetical protein
MLEIEQVAAPVAEVIAEQDFTPVPLPIESITVLPLSDAPLTPVRTPETVTLPPCAMNAGAETVIADGAFATLIMTEAVAGK